MELEHGEGRVWEDFDVAVDPGRGWVSLPRNGWGALMAYLAGPGHARGLVVPLDGDGPGVEEAIAAYLDPWFVPASPAGVTWQLRMPLGISAQDLTDGVAQAYELAGEGVVAKRVAVATYLASLLDDRY